MHLFFESLTIIGAPSLQASLMDIHHDTSLRSILEDDSISSTSKPRICSCSGKGGRVWLVVWPFIYSFHITHFIFSLTLHFHLGLIQPSASNLFMYECGHRLDTFGMHLGHCPFRGQWITTYDVVWNVMYAFIQESGHTVGENGGTPLHHKFHYQLILTWPKRTRS